MKRRSERGSGLLSQAFGVVFFLAFTIFATHTLVNLWAHTAVMAVADDTARRVAESPHADDNMAAVQAVELMRADRLLGAHRSNVSLTFEPDPLGRSVILHVRARPTGILARSPIGRFDVTVVARIEDR